VWADWRSPGGRTRGGGGFGRRVAGVRRCAGSGVAGGGAGGAA